MCDDPALGAFSGSFCVGIKSQFVLMLRWIRLLIAIFAVVCIMRLAFGRPMSQPTRLTRARNHWAETAPAGFCPQVRFLLF